MYTKVCKWCGLKHRWYPYQCQKNPKNAKGIKRLGKIAQKNIEFRSEWIQRNTNKEGIWVCYLQKHPNCPIYLTINTLTLEHVKSRSGNPHLRWDFDNVKPACWWDNSAKGSMSLEKYLNS